LLTRAENAKAYGGVLFDMAYASTYNQTNTFSKLLDLNENLVRKLGFTDFLKQQQDYKKRYIASRMESNGEAGKVNVSQSTYKLVNQEFSFKHRGKISAKNVGEIDMYFVDEQIN